ncbi:unnamed protein product, partial [marine sediment metagenome]
MQDLKNKKVYVFSDKKYMLNPPPDPIPNPAEINFGFNSAVELDWIYLYLGMTECICMFIKMENGDIYTCKFNHRELKISNLTKNDQLTNLNIINMTCHNFHGEGENIIFQTKDKKYFEMLYVEDLNFKPEPLR